MIDKKIQKLADDFVAEWNKHLAINPILILDYCWPSLGVLDLLTYSCRYRKEIPSQLGEVLKGVAAYLALIAEDCFKWSVARIEVTDTTSGVTIQLYGGEQIPEGQEVLIPIEKLLRELLSVLPSPLPVTRSFKTEINFESNIISLFGIGIFTGLAKGIEGWWSDKDEKYLQPVIEQTSKVLAAQSAAAYGRIFPEEPLGQLAELYLNKLIFPPTMMNESLPLLGVIPEVLEYLKDYNISADAALSLGENLSLSPDPLFSSLGLILCCAVSEKIPNARVLSAAESKGTYLSFLRRAVKEVRAFYGDKSDWMLTGLTSPQAYKQLAIEKSMKFLPWLYLSKNRIKEDIGNNILTPLIIKVCEYDFAAAIEFADKILEVHPDDVEVSLQRLKLELLKPKQDGEFLDRLLKQLMSNPKADSMPEYFSLLGAVALVKKDYSRALGYYKAALAIPSVEPAFLSDIQNNAAWCCMLLGQFAPALQYLDQALANSGAPVTILLNKSSILWDLGSLADAKKIRKQLFSLAPCDRRVFAALTLEEALKKTALH